VLAGEDGRAAGVGWVATQHVVHARVEQVLRDQRLDASPSPEVPLDREERLAPEEAALLDALVDPLPDAVVRVSLIGLYELDVGVLQFRERVYRVHQILPYHSKQSSWNL